MPATEELSTNAQERMARMILRALAYLRLGQFALWLWAPLVDGLGRYPLLVPVGYLAAAAWAAVLFTVGIRRNELTPRWLAADVAIAVGCAILVSRGFPPGQAASPHNWVLSPICGTAVTVAVYASRPAAVAAVGLIASAWLVGTWRDSATTNPQYAFNGAGVIVVFAAVAAFGGAILFRAARQADEAGLIAIEAQGREAAAEARNQERKRQYDKLHDTVLHTLENISRGVWDVNSRQARENCERDGDYLRGLISGGIDSIPTDLGAALAVMARDRSTLGSLRINQQFDALPPGLPAQIADALASAACEALNNAAKHAGVEEVWLTAFGDGLGGVTIVVVDRGAGFDQDAPHTGLGLTRSIRHRVIGIGGTVTVTSAPGEGTTVEMSWTP
jgi:signal transduction histidine kinase